MANLYLGVDSMLGSISFPRQLGLDAVAFPAGSSLTNGSMSLFQFRSALREVMAYNDIVGIQRGSDLELVKKEWLQLNAETKPVELPAYSEMRKPLPEKAPADSTWLSARSRPKPPTPPPRISFDLIGASATGCTNLIR
jgi:hypothetical protein